MSPARRVLNSHEMSRVLSRIAFEILETEDTSTLILLGIPTRGAHLARRLADRIARVDEDFDESRCGVLDVRNFRDDRDSSHSQADDASDIPCPIDGATVVLVDDVLSTGRTVRAAFDALTALGRPRAVRLAVLVDRGGREFPIRPDHVGKTIDASSVERVFVRVDDCDDVDEVLVERVNP